MALPVCFQNAIDAAVAAAGGTGSGSIVTATTSNNVDGTATLTITIDGTPVDFTACPTCSGGADGNDISTVTASTDPLTGVTTYTHTAGGVSESWTTSSDIGVETPAGSQLLNETVNVDASGGFGNFISGGGDTAHGITCGSFTDYHNQVDAGFLNTISGGGDNHIGDGAANIITGGAHNQIAANGTVWHGTINGGSCNEIAGTTSRVDYSVISGGSEQLIDSANQAGIYAGRDNQILNDGDGSVISGGRRNQIGGGPSLAIYSHISGGLDNTIGANDSANYSAIVGGTGHAVDEDRSAIIAGTNNTIAPGATRSVILGCQNVTATRPDTVYACRLNLANVPAYTSDAGAGVAGLTTGDVWQTSAANGIGLPPGVLMVKQ